MTQQNSTEQESAFKSSFDYATTTASEVANNWLLPDGVHDVLFEDADKQQYLRHQLIKQLQSRGYQLVTPPLIEFTESLLGNASEDLKRQTFKIIDQVSGRLMGVRADTTPQILRIDANHGGNDIARYCYAGHTIHTLPKGLFGLRTPLQLGAEIFGTDNILADFEMLDVVCQLLSSLNLTAKVHLAIGHVGIFKRLRELAQLTDSQAEQLMHLYANKALPELEHVCSSLPMGTDFYQLAQSGHSMSKLKTVLSQQAMSDGIIADAINAIEQIESYLNTHTNKPNGLQVSIDIAEVAGYHYHSGMVCHVYLNNASLPFIRGGRFEGGIDSTNKQNRPATGFSMDVTRLVPYFEMAETKLVLVDYADMTANNGDEQSKQLTEKVAALREQGYRVVVPLTADDKPKGISQLLKYDTTQRGWVLS